MYLSSFKLGNRPEALQELVGSDRRAAIVMNALDIFPDPRAQWLQAQSDALIKLGFSVSELDLRGYFGRENDLRGFACGEGLDLLPYAIAVHYKSDHPESSRQIFRP
jgi:hypothetical protein